MKVPCKRCTDRVVGCHSFCSKYKEFYALNEKRKQQIAEQREITNYVADEVRKSHRNHGKSTNKLLKED